MLSPRMNFSLRTGNSSGTGFRCLGDDSAAAPRPRPPCDRSRTCRSACLAPILLDDDGRVGAWAQRDPPVEPERAKAKAGTRRATGGLPVRSFTPPLAGLASLTLNHASRPGRPGNRFLSAPEPAELQAGAYELRGQDQKRDACASVTTGFPPKRQSCLAETAFQEGGILARHLETPVSDIRCDAAFWQFRLPPCGGDIGLAGRSHGSPNPGRACTNVT